MQFRFGNKWKLSYLIISYVYGKWRKEFECSEEEKRTMHYWQHEVALQNTEKENDLDLFHY